jgi:hypothetical protein
MKQQIFKEQDRVYHFLYGWGEVIKLLSNNNQSWVRVQFDKQAKGFEDNFRDGFLLSFTEYTLEGFSQERPEDLPELGNVVWVRDKDSDEWEVSHFYKKDHLGYHVSNDMKSYHVAIWSQLRKTNPYKNEETEA